MLALPAGGERSIATKADGRFEFHKLSPGSYSIWTVWQGIQSTRTTVDLRDRERFEVEFTVALDAAVLPDVTTEARGPKARPRVFEERMATDRGQYLTQDEIDERHALSLADLLRTMSGIRVTCGRDGCIPRFQRSPPNCTPRFFLDEVAVDAATAAATLPSDIRGIEVYQGPAQVPLELVREYWHARCGVIVIWTRRGPDPEPPEESRL